MHGPITHAEEEYIFKGKVTKNIVMEGARYVELELHAENGKGEMTTQYTAEIVLSSMAK